MIKFDDLKLKNFYLVQSSDNRWEYLHNEKDDELWFAINLVNKNNNSEYYAVVELYSDAERVWLKVYDCSEFSSAQNLKTMVEIAIESMALAFV